MPRTCHHRHRDVLLTQIPINSIEMRLYPRVALRPHQRGDRRFWLAGEHVRFLAHISTGSHRLGASKYKSATWKSLL